jgi:hypothetical protein
VPLHVGGVDFGTTSGTASSMRNALELSTTTQPALAAMGANSFEMPPPALNSAMSMPANESFVSSLTVMSWPRNLSFLADRARRGEQRQFAHRKISLFQRLDHFDADGAGRADHGHMRIWVHKRPDIIAETRGNVNALTARCA